MAYSFVGIQTLYLATLYNPIYWNTSCLIVNSSSLDNDEDEEEELSEEEIKKRNKSTNYDKIARAIGDIQKAGIKVSLIDINKSGYSFEPDVENNEILFGLKGLLNVGDEIVDAIIKNRPYSSPKDFVYKVKPKKSAMISLIKSGAFDKMVDRKFMLSWYIYETCDKKSRINLQNMSGLIANKILPTTNEFEMPYKVYEFNRYLKSKCKTIKDSSNYYIDTRCINFLTSIEKDNMVQQLISPMDFPNKYEGNLHFILNVKNWDKVYQKYMDTYRAWMSTNQQEILKTLNQKIFMADWQKYAKCHSPNLESAWEMEVMCFYYHQHELANIDSRYGYADFFKLPEQPVVDKVFYKKGVPINIYKLSKICGTCIAKNKTKSTVSLLTPTGVVTVKFRKEYFSLFDKQISVKGPDGKKKIMERSWFNRGNMIVVTGIRRDSDFIVKKYQSTGGHQLYKIDSIDDKGIIQLRDERYQGEAEEDDDD